MRAFAALCRRLDEARGAGDRVEALGDYLGRTPAADAIWAVSLFAGQRPPGIVSAHRLKQWATEACDLPPWLVEACHKVSGDLAETIALLVPPARTPDDRPLHRWIEQDLLPLGKMPLEDRRREVFRAWDRMDLSGRLVWNRLITGTFRMEIARDVVARALAQISGLPVEAVLARLTGNWPVVAETFARMVACDPSDVDPAAPGPTKRCPGQWKGESASFTADGVLLNARQGRGRQAGLYTDCTFGVWQGEALVPFARASEGLSETEIRELDRFVRLNTVARFGPVRSVRPELVFAIAFDGIASSRRHKSGLTVRSARIRAWRREVPAREADTLEKLRALLTPARSPDRSSLEGLQNQHNIPGGPAESTQIDKRQKYKFQMRCIKILYANHWPEVVPLMAERIGPGDVLVTEDAPSTEFGQMLAGTLSIDDYLMMTDIEFPEFGRRMCRLWRRLHRLGAAVIQVEPFIETLLEIHNFLAAGGTPDQIETESTRGRVYLAERAATGALLDFYQASTTADFEAVVDATLRFARCDARRFVLRDRMRAEAVAALAETHSCICLEAGSIHVALAGFIRRMAPQEVVVEPVFLMRAIARRLGRKGHLYPPGDLLTLRDVFHPGKIEGARHRLLAARALIYAKVAAKEELPPDSGPFSRTLDDLRTIDLVNRLSLEDCRRLFARIRRRNGIGARRVLMAQLMS